MIRASAASVDIISKSKHSAAHRADIELLSTTLRSPDSCEAVNQEKKI